MKNYLFNFLTQCYLFVKNLCSSQIENFALIPYIISLVCLIGLSNISGMVPYTLTLTSQIILTLTMALFSFMVINIIYFISKKFIGIELFLPTGAPLFIAPFLVQIELISYISRIISLSVRLFANLTSGHTLIKILSGFALSMLEE